MKQRRRLIAARNSRPVTASIVAAALVASAAVGIGTSSILQTQSDGIDPIDPTMTTASLADGENIVIDDPAIAAQGEGDAARTVKQFNRDEEFSQFAITWEGDKDLAAFVRGQRPDGTWSEWFDTEPLDYGSSDPNARQGTDLIFVEPTTAVQVSLSGVDLVEGNEAKELDVVFIDGGESKIAANGINLTSDSDGLPKVISRKGWGADESIRCSNPSFSDGTAGITIHHTAGSNNYTQEQAPGIMRGIYKYHAQNLGWCDVGYHALADKFGNLYEGRYGGLNKNIIGAHAGGFNENTWAISMIGNYQTAEPSSEMIQAVGELAGWRAKVAGIDPTGKGAHYSEGTKYTPYPQGARVELPNIFAHRDVGLTECPGDYAYAQMGTIRNTAKAKYDSIGGTSHPNSTPSPDSTPSDSTTENSGTTPSRQESTRASNAASNALDLLKQLQNIGNTKDPKVIGTAAASLISVVIGIASALGILPGSLSKLGDVKIINGLTLSSIPTMVDKIAGLSSDSPISKLWKTLSPILGSARTGEIQYTNGYGQDITYALFDNGIIIGSPETGPQALWGVIGDTWAAQGLDMGPLGLPLNQEYQEGDLLRVDFEGGYITFDPATGAVDVKTNVNAEEAMTE